LASFACLSFLTACGDDAPVYPPIVIVEVGANFGGSGNTGTGNVSTGNTGTGNTNSNGGSSNSGGSGGATGSAADPLFAHCALFANAPPPPVKTKCDLNALTDGGQIKGDITADKSLKGGQFYTLSGGVRVSPGVKLTIEPCTKIIGEDSDAVLVMLSSELGNPKRSCTYSSGTITKPAAQLIAVGEPMAPIIFTSSKPVGQRAPGDWGGVLLLGNAHNDLANQGTRVPVEGLAQTECHGYYNKDFDGESSGHLEYVRIEYASRQVAADNETNGLTFGSVGSGTEIHYVEVSNSADDCMAWFGGSVNAVHLISLNCDDDSFDNDEGYSGKLQFLFGRQFPTTTEADSRGLEISTGKGPKALLTTVSYSNYTLCGGGPTDHNLSRQAAYFDSNAIPSLMNGLVTGFAGPGLARDTASADPAFSHTRIFGEPLLSADASFVTEFLGGTDNSTEDPDRFCDCWANPPAPFAATTIPGAAPDGFGDPSAAYLGAFADAKPGSNWMTGSWVDWSSK
jgi:hypothetical protein